MATGTWSQEPGLRQIVVLIQASVTPHVTSSPFLSPFVLASTPSGKDLAFGELSCHFSEWRAAKGGECDHPTPPHLLLGPYLLSPISTQVSNLKTEVRLSNCSSRHPELVGDALGKMLETRPGAAWETGLTLCIP